LKRYKVLYEKAHPATKHGARGRGRKKEEDDEADRFTKNAAKSLGLSERSVYDLIKVAELPEEEKKTIEEAKTPKERNVAAHQALRKVRQEKKEEKLKEKAVAKRKERAKAPAKKPPTIGLQKGQIEDVAPTLQGYKFDLVLADPPYGLSRSTVSHRKRTSINEAVAWDELDLAWVDLVAGLLDKEATIIVFCCAEHVGAYADRFKELGLDYRGHIVWHKTNPAPSHRPTYTMATEHIVWATKGKAPYFKPWKNAGSKASHNVIEGPICGGDERMDHPAQKPLWLIKRLVMRHSQRKDRVIDPFAGTGTTLVACKAMGRVALGVEVSPKFLRMAKLRLEAL
jgi:DNA modification methylase